MNCATCDRPHSKDLPFNCVGCARGFIYNSRLDALSAILDNENLFDKVRSIHDSVVRKSTADGDGKSANENATLAARWRKEQQVLQLNETKERISTAQMEIAALRQHIQRLRDETQSMRTTLSQRRLEVEDSRKAASVGSTQRLGESSSHLARAYRSYDLLNKRTTEARLNLCREAALLMGLRHKRKRRHGEIFELYSVSGLLIPDLREISGTSDFHSRLLPVANWFQVSNPQICLLSCRVLSTSFPLQHSI